MATGIRKHHLDRSLHASERVHDWANGKDERHERLFATELVLAYEFGDPEPLASRRFLSPEAAQLVRDEFAALITETGLPAGRHAHRKLGDAQVSRFHG